MTDLFPLLSDKGIGSGFHGRLDHMIPFVFKSENPHMGGICGKELYLLYFLEALR